MKQLSLFSLLTFLSLFLVGCSQESTKTSGSSSNPYCQYNPYSYGCPGYTGGTNGGQNPYCQQNPFLQGCPQFCQYNPTHASCVGSTTGGTTGGSTNPTCLQNPYAQGCPQFCQYNPTHVSCRNPYPDYQSDPKYPNWGVRYPGGQPPESCSPTFTPDYISEAGYTPWETRKATITLAGMESGNIMYAPSPLRPDASQMLNTSPDMMDINGVKRFYATDSILKLRIKVRPQPNARKSDQTLCHDRNIEKGSTTPGYTKLQYYVKVYGITDSNSVNYLATLGPYTTTVNGCSPAIHLSQFKAESPNGVFVTIDQVKSNQDCWWDDGPNGTGFLNCNNFKNVRSFDCWQMELEVASDGTKTFN